MYLNVSKLGAILTRYAHSSNWRVNFFTPLLCVHARLHACVNGEDRPTVQGKNLLLVRANSFLKEESFMK